MKGTGKKKSLYRATKHGKKTKKCIAKDIVDNKKSTLFYVKPNKAGKLCIYSKPIKSRKSPKTSRKRRSKKC